MAPILPANEIRPGMWVTLPGQEWPAEVEKVTKAGPALDLYGRGPRRTKVRIYTMTAPERRFHDYREDALVATY